jgi:hypothetical protein
LRSLMHMSLLMISNAMNMGNGTNQRTQKRGDNRAIGAFSVVLVCCVFLVLLRAQTPAPAINADLRSALDYISEDSLRGHLSFIASDLLEGRATPSRGLDIAAEYIAAQFRRTGLEPVGDDGYFQTANWKLIETPETGFGFSITSGSEHFALSRSQISYPGDAAFDLRDETLVKVVLGEIGANQPSAEAYEGRVLITDAEGRNLNQVASILAPLRPALILIVDRTAARGRGYAPPRLIDPEFQRPGPQASPLAGLIAHEPRLGALYDSLPSGPTAAKLTLSIPARVERSVKLRNVVGLLRGSDPELKETYVLVTAHYDHVGMRADLEGDQIFNGANDDGSGTVAVIEIAAALSKLKTRPKRSIVFMTVFGEERGLLGSRYYGRNPIFPLKDTVANINLEHVGRTDSSEGSQVNRATLTGFDYSDLGPIFKAAGEAVGIEVYKHEKNSDAFFGRSDNQALADAGVPAHTLCVAFIFPDYHQVGDHWDKIDYPNLAKTARMTALALVMIAENRAAPRWNTENPKTQRYVEAWKKLQGSGSGGGN